MARVEVKTKNPNIHIIVDSGTKQDVVNMVKELYGFIASRSEAVPNPSSTAIPEKLQEMGGDIEKKEPEKNPWKITVPGMRERLPNNVVDPSSLSVKEAVKENALVRCPHCGQNHIIALKSGADIYVMRMNYQKNNYEMLTQFAGDNPESLKDICFDRYKKMFKEIQGGTNKDAPKAYWEYIQSIVHDMSDDVDFVVENETEIFCPVCGKSETFAEWKNCCEHPLDYFEYEHICDACGGEMSIIQAKGKTSEKCDKCGWEKGGGTNVS